MPDIPDWLPDLISTDGEWNNVLERLYTIFKSDFKNGKPHLNGSRVWWDKRILEDDCYEEGFWHLISKNDRVTQERLFDPRRAERMPWCRPCIDNLRETLIKFWDYKVSGSRVKTYLWIEDFDYVIIFQKRRQRVGTVYFLLTAYYVEGDSTRRKLKRKYNNREA